MARLKELYVKEVAPALMNKFSYKSTMQIPKLDKIVINVGAGEARENSKAIDAIVKDIAAITGQKPMVCHARILATHLAPNFLDTRYPSARSLWEM